MGGELLAVVLSVVTAFLYTAGLAMQQRGNLDAMRADAEQTETSSAVVAVLKRPMWLLGNLVGFAGFGTQALALAFGPFLLVTPIIATELAFMVPAGAWVVRTRVQGREWLPAVMVLAGVAVFELAFRPQPGRDTGSAEAWILTFAISIVLIAAMFAAGRALPNYRAALYGFGAGAWAALLGALLKEATGGSLWALAAIAIAGPLNVLLLNVAVRAGRLSSAQTTVVASGTVVSLAVGVGVFSETVELGVWSVLAGLAAVAVAGWGIAGLARSPSLLVLDEISHPD